MPISRDRTFTVTTVDGKTVQVRRSVEHLYLDGLPTAFITPDVNGEIHIFTGRPHATMNQLHSYIVSGSTFWDILYDVPPTKEFAGQLQALLMQFQQLSVQFVNQLPSA
jgi:hypothetical protein